MKNIKNIQKIAMLIALISFSAYAVYSSSNRLTLLNKMKTVQVTISGTQNLQNCGNGAAYVVITTSSGSDYKIYDPSISTYNFEFGMYDTGNVTACIEFQTTPQCCNCMIGCGTVPIGSQNTYNLSIVVMCDETGEE